MSLTLTASQSARDPPTEDEVLDNEERVDSAPVDQTAEVTNTDSSPPESRRKDEQSKKSKSHRGEETQNRTPAEQPPPPQQLFTLSRVRINHVMTVSVSGS